MARCSTCWRSRPRSTRFFPSFSSRWPISSSRSGWSRGRGNRPGLQAGDRVLLLVWLFGPIPWVEIAYYGHFDVLVGLLCVAAVEARVRGRERCERREPGSGCLAQVHADRSSAIPGPGSREDPVPQGPGLVRDHRPGPGSKSSPLGPVNLSTFALRRRQAVRASLDLPVSEWQLQSAQPDRVQREPGPVGSAHTPRRLAADVVLGPAERDRPVASSVVAILVTLLFYHVGFPQYQMVLFVLATYWAVRYRDVIRHRTLLWIAMVCYFGWLSVFDLIDTSWILPAPRSRNGLACQHSCWDACFSHAVCDRRPPNSRIPYRSPERSLERRPGKRGAGASGE